MKIDNLKLRTKSLIPLVMMALTVLGCAALTWAAHVGIRPTLER